MLSFCSDATDSTGLHINIVQYYLFNFALIWELFGVKNMAIFHDDIHPCAWSLCKGMQKETHIKDNKQYQRAH